MGDSNVSTQGLNDSRSTGIQRKRRIDIDLPTARMSSEMIREMHAAIPQVLRRNIKWSAEVPQNREVSGHDLDAFLNAIAGEPELTKIHLFAHSSYGHGEISVLCTPSFVVLQCRFDEENELQFSIFANFAKGIFGENHQSNLTTLGPIIIPEHAPKEQNEPVPAAMLETGSTPVHGENGLPFWSRLNWQKIVEDIISRVASYLIIASVSGLVGGFIGYLLGRM